TPGSRLIRLCGDSSYLHRTFWVAVFAETDEAAALGVVALTLTFFAPFQSEPTITWIAGPSEATCFSLAPGSAAARALAESTRPGPYWITVVVHPVFLFGAGIEVVTDPSFGRS